MPTADPDPSACLLLTPTHRALLRCDSSGDEDDGPVTLNETQQAVVSRWQLVHQAMEWSVSAPETVERGDDSSYQVLADTLTIG